MSTFCLQKKGRLWKRNSQFLKALSESSLCHFNSPHHWLELAYTLNLRQVWVIQHNCMTSKKSIKILASESQRLRPLIQATQKVEAGGFQVQGPLQLQSKYKVSLCNLLRPCLKKQNPFNRICEYLGDRAFVQCVRPSAHFLFLHNEQIRVLAKVRVLPLIPEQKVWGWMLCLKVKWLCLRDV